MKIFNKYPILMIIVGVLGISMSAIFVRYSAAPSAVTALYRLVWTVVLLSPAVFGNAEIRRELFAVTPRARLLSAISGILLAVHFSTWFESLHHTTVASSTIIVCTEVIWVAIGFRIFLGGKLGGKTLAAIGLALAGSVLIAWSDSSEVGNGLYGDILSLIAAIAVAAYTLLGRIVRKETGTTVYTYIVYFYCAVTLLLITIVQGYSTTGYGYSGVVTGLLLAVFSTLLGHSVFSWCLKYFSPTFVSASKLCEPVISSLFAAMLFREVPGGMQIAGGIIVIAGVVYYSLLEIGTETKE